jgi:DNA-binding NarL/FixJ family response regulator
MAVAVVAGATGLEGGGAVEQPKAPARGPYAKTAARRPELVRAARESVAERGYAGASLRLAALTARERQVMALAAEGRSNDEIAEDLFVSPLTVRTHVHRAMTKLNARDRAQLVVIAYQSGLVRPTPPQP